MLVKKNPQIVKILADFYFILIKLATILTICESENLSITNDFSCLILTD